MGGKGLSAWHLPCHKGEHIAHLWGVQKKNNNKKRGEFLFLSLGHVLKSFPPFQCTDFMKCVRELQIINKQFETPAAYGGSWTVQKCQLENNH
jgi:hypothetical protein